MIKAQEVSVVRGGRQRRLHKAFLRNDWEGARSRYANYKVPAAWRQIFLRRARFSPACFEAGYVIDKERLIPRDNHVGRFAARWAERLRRFAR